MWRRLVAGLAAGALVAGGAPRARAWDSPAPDVVVYSTPALAGALGAVGARWTRGSDVAVHVFVAPPDGLVGLLKHRARDDVVVSDAATMGVLARARLVRAESVVGLGRDAFALIGRAGEPSPAGADAGRLAAARQVVLPDATAAGSFDGAAVLRAAGVTALGVVGVSDTPAVVAAVRDDGRVVGLVHRTEAAAPGVVQLAPLPYPATEFSAALVTGGQSTRAGELLAFIAGAEGMAMLRSAGMEPAP